MKVRLRDFAEANRISERTVQIHIKNNIDFLQEHIERKGKQGTWLDEKAVDFLLNQIQLPNKEEVFQPTPRELQYIMQIADLNAKLADAERRAGENAGAAGKLQLLEEQSASIQKKNEDLQKEVGLLEGFIQDAKKEIEELKKESAEEKTELQREIDDMKNASVWQRLKGWK